MPASPRETVLCRYRYDPLDRLVDCAPSAEAGIQRFYCKSRLATEIQGAVQRSVFQHDDQLLAQHRREDAKVKTALLATDQQRSVLNVLDANRVHPLAYSPYGHRPAESGLLSLLGFNGERPDPVTGHYLLGNGYRAFNPVLMRFNSPDSLSPFGEGGVNAYGYCGGDSINRSDPTGHIFKRILRGFGLMKPKTTSTVPTSNAPILGLPLRETYACAELSLNGTGLFIGGQNINPLSKNGSLVPANIDEATVPDLFIMRKYITAKTDLKNMILKLEFPDFYAIHKDDPLISEFERYPLLLSLEPRDTTAMAISDLRMALLQYGAVQEILNFARQTNPTPNISPTLNRAKKIRRSSV
ncbi:RHS repeat-associated core domain-containing protein [Pseudomonas kilonensis]|uniref:RHS repeat-associated core domain-containing protein n=1 Tax=Pseudomonas kilonensis TaxID=132476 RepID=A0ABY0YTC1_9PSED|nr:RHS repeat-associated core domain-containing protein [Pseudomonas kilonensis]SED93125.1 RHS repeat-associated core domain-containing protein [Pseudomonas kilonensis]